MNPKNNSSITYNANKPKTINATILEKLKNIKLQLSKYKNNNNKFLINNNSNNNKIITNKSKI